VADRSPRSSWSTIVAKAAQGDVDALAQLMAAHDGDMVRVCMVICGDADLAREAVQAAWIKAWRRLDSVHSPDRLRPWLMSVAANEARQILRSAARRYRYERRSAPPAPGLDPGLRAEVLDLAEAVSRLDVDERRLLGLRYAAGLSSEEIAHEMGGSAASVRGRLARLTSRLRSELGDA
jgi:RNA polymerase sigma-70 factor (ECF subfamily)